MTNVRTALVDVNVLFALAWPNHEHHDRARRWFVRGDDWASTPITQAGLVRLSSNAGITRVRMSPADACRLLADILARSGHVFWPDDLSGVIGEVIDPAALTGHRQITDAHLVSLAHAHGGYLATFDARLRALIKPGFEQLIGVIE